MNYIKNFYNFFLKEYIIIAPATATFNESMLLIGILVSLEEFDIGINTCCLFMLINSELYEETNV
jgi:hypothetical protein